MKKNIIKFLILSVIVLIISLIYINTNEGFKNQENIKLIVTQHDGGFFSNFNKMMIYLIDNPNITCIEYNIIASPSNPPMYYVKKDEEVFSKLLENYDENVSIDKTITISTINNGFYNSPANKLYFDSANNYNENRYKLEPFNKAYNKYIKIQPHILTKIDAYMDIINEGNPQQLIGILVRSQAVQEGQNKSAISPQKYLDAINNINKDKSTKYFFCIDNKQDLEYYKEQLVPNFYLDLNRSENNLGDSPHMSDDVKSLDELEKIFIQVVLLSKCDILVHCNSNMATTSLFMNMDQQSIFIE